MPDRVLNELEWSNAACLLQQARSCVREGRRKGIDDALEFNVVRERVSVASFNYAVAALNAVLNLPAEPLTGPDDPLDVPYWGRRLMYWSDAHSKEEIEAALTEAMEFARGREERARAAGLSDDDVRLFDEGMARAG